MVNIKLELGNLEVIRTVNPRLMSYNVEMTEVTPPLTIQVPTH